MSYWHCEAELALGTNREEIKMQTKAEIQAEWLANELFPSWLNEIDARIDYEVRRQISLVEWRHLFDLSYSAKDACLMALTGRVR